MTDSNMDIIIGRKESNNKRRSEEEAEGFDGTVLSGHLLVMSVNGVRLLLQKSIPRISFSTVPHLPPDKYKIELANFDGHLDSVSVSYQFHI